MAARAMLLALRLVLVLVLVGCASADRQQTLKEAAVTPLKDLNVIKVDIPDVLRNAEKGTFVAPAGPRCDAVQAEIASLDIALGRNGDESDAGQNETADDKHDSNLLKRGTQQVEKAAAKALQSTAEDVVPFRKWVRKLTGAERRSADLADAVAAGYARRSFLRGYASALQCESVSKPAQADAYSSASAVSLTQATVPTQPPLDWLVGSWCMQKGNRVIEEIWLPKRGDVWFGISRTVSADATKGFEFVRIAIQDGVLNYLAQPEGGALTAFSYTGGADTWVRFENPQHDFPTRIEYRRDGERLTASIFGPDGTGKDKAIHYPYQRCPILP